MKNSLILGVMLLINSSVFAQFLNISEIDEAGNVRPLVKLREAIDINSQLSIELNKRTLTEAAITNLIVSNNTSVDSIIFKLKLYRSFIEKIQSRIGQYEQIIKSKSRNTDMLTTALRGMAIVGDSISKLFPEGSRFQKLREEKLEAMEHNMGRGESYRIIMSLLAAEIQLSDDEVKKILNSSGYYFQLAAWIYNKRGAEPIHLSGFDDIQLGKYYNYQRNQLHLTQAQIDDLESLTNFFETMNKGNVFEKLSEILDGLLSKAVDLEGIKMNIDKVQTLAKQLNSVTKAQKDTILSRVNTLAGVCDTFRENLEKLKKKYTDSSGITSANSKIEVLTGFSKDVQYLTTQIESIGAMAKNIVTIKEFNEIGNAANDLKKGLYALSDTLSNAAENLIDYSRDAFHLAIYGREINTAALEVSKKVYKLALDKIPASTMLDLNYTGKRDPGDLVVIKAMLWKGEDKSPVQTETRSFPMMNALAHLHMSVAYAFAKPVVKGKNFEGGPLVSVLYKFKSHSLAYRNFLDIGIGLHSAAYDFNNDDTPEFAGGFVTSIFRDYLQFGWGFNFNAKQGYWFTGLRIPIQSTPISLISSAR